jgi:hypothetical protein
MNIERRAGRVNIVDSGSSNSDNEEEEKQRLKFCPMDGRELVWVDEVPSYFCPKCGYSSHGAPLPLSFNTTTATTIASEATTTTAAEEEAPTLPVDGKLAAQSLSQKVSLDETTTSTSSTATDNNLFIMSVSKSRSEEQEKQLKQKRFPGLDQDTDLLESKGYTLISSAEYMENNDNNSTTISLEDLKREKERRTKGKW